MKGVSRSASNAVRTLSPRRRASRDGETSKSKVERTTSSTGRRRRSRNKQGRTPVVDVETSEEEFLKEWGITRDREEKLLVEYRNIIEKEVGPLRAIFDKFYLRRFLRARQHDLSRAKDMFMAHLKWRKDMGVDDIENSLHFHERDAFLTLYPQGYHKTDRLGRPIYIQHLGQINVKALMRVTTEERMILFHIQEYERALKYIFPACSLIAGKHISQTLAIMDLKGVGLRHLTGEVKRILSAITRTDQDNYPETLGKTLIINAPTVFRAIWAVVKPMLDPRTQTKIQVCSSDYMPELLEWADIENIPSYLGGKSKGSLLDDVGPWHDPALRAEIDAQRARAEGRSAETPEPPESPFVTSNIDFERESSAQTERDTDREDVFQDAVSRRFSTTSAYSSASAYLSADEGAYYSSDGGGGRPSSQVRAIEATSDGESVTDSPKHDRLHSGVHSVITTQKSGGMQISILARVKALEEKLPMTERPLKRHFTPGEPAPSRSVGQGTLLSRVAALEKAMDTLLQVQEAAIRDNDDSLGGGHRKRGCCAGCSVM